jgi:teichuronic acid biosynthesis glycosyltransferase TuaC
MRVLMVTSEWPTSEHPDWVPFLVQQVAFLRKAGVDVDVFSFRGAKQFSNYLRAWMQVQRKRSSNHYDLVHAQFGQSGLITLPKSLPLVITFHGSDLQGDPSFRGRYTLQGRLLKMVSRFVALFADEIIVVSSAKSLWSLLPLDTD